MPGQAASSWADALGVQERDVPGLLFGLVRQIREIDERVMRFRSVVHEGPDPELDAALLLMERAAHTATERVEDAHREVVRHV